MPPIGRTLCIGLIPALLLLSAGCGRERDVMRRSRDLTACLFSPGEWANVDRFLAADTGQALKTESDLFLPVRDSSYAYIDIAAEKPVFRSESEAVSGISLILLDKTAEEHIEITCLAIWNRLGNSWVITAIEPCE